MSAPADVKILFVGDMHLGRNASRVPPGALAQGHLDAADLTPAAAWQGVVDTAREHDVRAVALAGDLVHHDDDLFEARALLETGIVSLNEAGIEVVAVAGNHDTLVLPKLAASIAGLHLLGPGGTWTTFAVTPRVRLAGWSFPAPHHTASPLETAPPPPETGTVTLGLLHADLDTTNSDYAPVSSAALAAIGYQGWALGHIHVPSPTPAPEAPHTPFYLGSINGSSPNETGSHGPVLATIGADGGLTWTRLPLAPMRWEHLVLDLSTLLPNDDPRAFDLDLSSHLLAEVCRLDVGHARALGLRVTLTGTHPQADELQRALAKFTPDDLVTLNQRCAVFIEKITNEVTIPLDLEALARRSDLPGLVAREILSLLGDDPAAADLLRRARAALSAPPLGTHPLATTPNDAELRQLLCRTGRQTLNTLLASHREPAP